MPISNTNGAPRAGTVAAASFKGPFTALDASEDLQILFRTYPRLSAQLRMIDSATHQPVNQYGGYQNGRGRKEPTWNTDIGMQKGVDAMYRAKSAEDGEGVREYCKLILHILSGDSDVNTEEMIQKEIVDENVRMIRGLLSQEQG